MTDDPALFDALTPTAPSPEQPDLFAESVDTDRTVIDYLTSINVIRAAADARERGDHRTFMQVINTANPRILADVIAFAAGQLTTARRHTRSTHHVH